MVDAPLLPAPPPVDRRPWLGYGMAVAAALLWSLNGVVVKVLQLSGDVSSLRLGQVRNTGALLGLLAVILIVRPSLMRVRLRDLPFLAVFGIAGLALVQWLYLVAITRMPISIALLIEYIAPVLVAVWARFVMKEPVRRRVWAALALALAGLALVVKLWEGLALDGVGVAAALAAAVAFAFYLLLAEHEVGRRDPVSLICYGFLFGSLFWALIQPWWTFPGGLVGDSVSLLGNLAHLELPVWSLMAWMIVLGTIIPFALMVGALRHASATKIGLVAMLEPVAAALVAYAWLGEELAAVQLLGGAVVLAGILLAQTAR